MTPPIRLSENDITALEANRAAATMLLVQAVGGGVISGVTGIDTAPAMLLTVAINVVLLLTVFRSTFEKLLNDRRWRTRPDLLTSIVVFILALWSSRAFAAGVLFLYPEASPAETVEMLTRGSEAPLLAFVMLLTGGILVPIIEEIAFRGLLLRGHERALGPLLATLVDSFLFAFAHGALLNVVALLPMAYMLSRLVQHSGSIWNGVIVHALNNLSALALALSLSSQLGGMPDLGSSGLKEAKPLLGLVALFMGVVPLVLAHFWLTPKKEEDHPRVGGPWFSFALLLPIALGALGLINSLGLLKP